MKWIDFQRRSFCSDNFTPVWTQLGHSFNMTLEVADPGYFWSGGVRLFSCNCFPKNALPWMMQNWESRIPSCAPKFPKIYLTLKILGAQWDGPIQLVAELCIISSRFGEPSDPSRMCKKTAPLKNLWPSAKYPVELVEADLCDEKAWLDVVNGENLPKQ